MPSGMASRKKCAGTRYHHDGRGIGERGGSYGHTKQLWQEFGAERVIDTPISENGFCSMAVGAAVCGLHPIVDMMFADIVFEAMSQLAQQASKLSYMSGGRLHVPMVVRAQMGARSTGPHHSASLYPLFMHLPGFKVVVPGNAYDAKGLMKAALRNPVPVMFFENKFEYAQKGEIPDGEYIVPLGKANVVRAGRDVTAVAVGTMVRRITEAIEKGLIEADVEIVDPRTLWPLDVETIVRSVEKTGRLVIIEEAYYNCNAGAEIAARIAEIAFGTLRAPIVRVAMENCPHPYSPVLEAAVLTDGNRIAKAIDQVIHWRKG